MPLNEAGRAQARRNGEALRAEIGNPATFDFVSSPLGRARETMEIIRDELGVDPAGYRVDERLTESAYGIFEGLTIAEMNAAHPQLIAMRQSDRWNFRPPGGESHADTLARIRPWYDALSHQSVIVAHGAVGRALRYLILGLPSEKAAWYEFAQDKVFRFENGRETLL